MFSDAERVAFAGFLAGYSGLTREARGRARATVARRLCTVAGFYRYAVEEELLAIPRPSMSAGRVSTTSRTRPGSTGAHLRSVLANGNDAAGDRVQMKGSAL